jgi:FMN-dependent NADH-azoreductase
MSSLLAIEVSPRFEYSASRKLTAQFIGKWKAEHSGGQVVVRDLAKANLPFVDLPWIGGAFTPAAQHSPESTAAIKVSNELVSELMAADHIVIGTPMYNFTIPAALKAYIDHIVRAGVTFSPNPRDRGRGTLLNEGLVKGKKVTIILTSAGDYSPGMPFESYNFASPYLRAILGFIGLTDVNIVLAGQAMSVDQGQKTMDEFALEFDAALSKAAAV